MFSCHKNLLDVNLHLYRSEMKQTENKTKQNKTKKKTFNEKRAECLLNQRRSLVVCVGVLRPFDKF